MAYALLHWNPYADNGLTGPDRGDWLGVQYCRKQWVDAASPAWFGTPPPGTATTQMG